MARAIFRSLLKAHRGREQHHELVILGDLNDFRGFDMVRGAVEQPAAGEHPSGISQPHGIPVRLDFARRRPPRAGASIKLLKARRIQQKRFHYGRHQTPSGIGVGLGKRLRKLYSTRISALAKDCCTVPGCPFAAQLQGCVRLVLEIDFRRPRAHNFTLGVHQP